MLVIGSGKLRDLLPELWQQYRVLNLNGCRKRSFDENRQRLGASIVLLRPEEGLTGSQSMAGAKVSVSMTFPAHVLNSSAGNFQVIESARSKTEILIAIDSLYQLDVSKFQGLK